MPENLLPPCESDNLPLDVHAVASTEAVQAEKSKPVGDASAQRTPPQDDAQHGGKKPKGKSRRKIKVGSLPPYSAFFEQCWEKYPHKVYKGPAWGTFRQWQEKGEIPDDLPHRIENRKFEPDWLENWSKNPERIRFIPHMSTWLDSRGWEDHGCFDTPTVSHGSPEKDKLYDEIMGKYNCGMPSPGETPQQVWAKCERMDVELAAAGL
jgi:hypothetical protein